MSQNPSITPFNCTTCDISKMTKTPFSGTFPITSRKLEVLHIDLCGPISPKLISRKKYFLIIVNGFSHYVWIYFLKNKSESKDIIKIERQENLLVGSIVSNNGSKFKNNYLSSFLVQQGISHLTSAPYTPEQNPFAERGNQTTVNKARFILKDSCLDLSYWAEEANTSIYLETLTPHKALNFLSPFLKWHNKPTSFWMKKNFSQFISAEQI
ncbi:hypothetical protein O181_068894 [Austropuccinia psidii MF-1]|uniref:Integrase catalytic domain-containing protein n=1 Tax=Austropuccinia psidii MF-1 TaxID=1389203 RepID=A0A9Q3I806_9BASI|nr:hypothetical protein [Austropuccinia psidii MF-1]